MVLIFITFVVAINLLWSAFILYHLSRFGVGLESRLLSLVFVLGLIAFVLIVFSLQSQINFDVFSV